MAQRTVNQNRNVLLWLLLSVCTLGVYNLWFINHWADDVNLICDGDGDQTPGLGAFLIYDLLTFGVYKYVWLSRLADRLAENAPHFGVDECIDGETVFIWFVLCLPLFGIGPLLAMGMVMFDTNSVARAYNAGIASPHSHVRVAAAPHSSVAAGALLGLAGTYRGRRVTLDAGKSVVIGRDSISADIVVRGDKISRKHCIISYNAKTQTYQVRDVSTNGVWANGKRLNTGKSYTMSAGAVLKLADGSAVFKLL